jgi:hypothetical protein
MSLAYDGQRPTLFGKNGYARMGRQFAREYMEGKALFAAV